MQDSFAMAGRHHVVRCLLAAGSAAAFPSYRLKVPMGNKVACYDGADGCAVGSDSLGEPASVCRGLGHATCAGGTFPLSAFGQALEDAGYAWTQELCQADSDGDGQTNGQELGDPCCQWTEGSTASAYMATFNPSHPGDASSSQGADYVVPVCGEATAPGMLAPHIGGFNHWEEQRVVDFRIKNFSIPPQRTVYKDFVFNLPDTDHGIFHIVYGEAIVDQPAHLHHYVIQGCSQRVPDHLQGVPLSADDIPEDCGGPPGPKPGRPYTGWAPGNSIWDFPTYAGSPIGEQADTVAFRVNVHFTDGDLNPGAVSQDGFRIFYTPDLRNYTVDITTPIWLASASRVVIPQAASRWFITRTCTVVASCSDLPDEEGMAQFGLTCSMLSFICTGGSQYSYLVRQLCPVTCGITSCSGFDKDGNIPVVGVNFHGHLLASEMYQTLSRNGSMIDMGSAAAWHYDDQVWHSLLSLNFSLRVGDVLQSTCVYDSTERPGPTKMGTETVDEMCIIGLSTLRHMSAETPQAAFACQGKAWAGQLGAEEDGMQVALAHPWQESSSVWNPAVSGLVQGAPITPEHLCPAGSQARPWACGNGTSQCCEEKSKAQCGSAEDGSTSQLVGLTEPCRLRNDGRVSYTYMCCEPFTMNATTATSGTAGLGTSVTATSTTTPPPLGQSADSEDKAPATSEAARQDGEGDISAGERRSGGGLLAAAASTAAAFAAA